MFSEHSSTHVISEFVDIFQVHYFTCQQLKFSTHELYPILMTLPLSSLSVDALPQPILELQDLIAQLKALRWSLSSVGATLQHTELVPNMESINVNLTHVIESYENLLRQAKADFRNAFRQYVNHYASCWLANRVL